jgi:hypothetical protein
LKRLKQIQENKTQSLIFAFLIIAVIAFTVSAHQNNRVQLPEITKDSLANSVSAREEIKPVLADYDSTLTFELKNAANVGAAVAVVYKNEIVYLKWFKRFG